MSSSKTNDKTSSKQRVPLTEEIVAELRGHMKRTGIGSTGLLAHLGDLPEGFNLGKLNAWMCHGVASARKDHLDFVLKHWRALPDTTIVGVTSELRRHIRSEIKRTGKGTSAMMRGLRPSDYDGLCSHMIEGWLSGNTSNADKSKIDFVIARWKALPDYDDEWISLSECQYEFLKAEMSRVQISRTRFLSERDDLPPGLTRSKLNAVLSGRIKSIRRNHYEYLLEALAEISAETSSNAYGLRIGHVSLTDNMRAELSAERERTGVTEKALVVVIAASGGTQGIKHRTINGWINRPLKSVPEALYEEVIAAWRSLPDKNAFWEK